MKLIHLATLILAAGLLNFSCTAYKQVPYFQDLRRDTLISEKIDNFSPLTLQPGDLLGLNVTSLNRDADLIYNYNLIRLTTNGSDLPSNQGTDVTGYLVDQDGKIKLPNIGDVSVAGLTTKEAAALLEQKLNTYLSSPVVNVRMLNFKVSVLGDVKNPGSFSVKNERISITEALSLAGDLNTTGVRTNVLLVREKDGKRDYVTLDLQSKKIFNSPYYYLKNNDVLYVTPNRSRAFVEDDITTKIGVILSALSILVLVFKK